MRLALVTETFAPDVNGVSLTLDHLCRGLARLGVTIDLVCPGQASVGQDQLQHWQAAGHPLPGYRQLRFGWGLPARVRQHWKLSPPDVFYLATEGPLGLDALWYARRHGIPVISGFHTDFERYLSHYRLGLLRPLARSYLRWFHNASSLTLTPSTGQQQLLQAQGYQRVRLLGRGVDTSLFSPARRCESLRRELGLQPEQLLVGCVGRLAAEKNLALLLRAFQAIQQQQPDARLLLVGDGPWQEQVHQACPDALLVGSRQGEDLARHYASMDLFLFPSLTETWGNVVAEALASGLPLVAFDRAAAATLIRDGENGCLVAPQDEQHAARFIQASVALAGDEHRRLVLGHLASRSMQAVGWEGIVARFYQLLLASQKQEAGHQGLSDARLPGLDRKA